MCDDIGWTRAQRPLSPGAFVIGVFEFVLGLVLISTLGKVLSSRQARHRIPEPTDRPEIAQLNDAVSELNARLVKLEDERDFYRALLESPNRGKEPLPRPEDAPRIED